MKRIINIFLFLILVAMGVNAQRLTTTDRVDINQVTLDMKNRDTTVYLEFNLSGGTIYTAYQLDVTLPEGVCVAKYEDELDIYIENASLYPTDRKGSPSTHALSWSDDVTHTFTVGCMSTKSEELKATSGALFNIGLTTNDDAVVGEYEVKLSDVYLVIKEGAVKYKAPDTTAKLVITNTTGISEKSNDNKATAYTLEGIKVDAPQKGHLYIVDGKKVKF